MINNKHVKILLAHPKLLENGNNEIVKLNNNVFFICYNEKLWGFAQLHKQPVNGKQNTK